MKQILQNLKTGTTLIEQVPAPNIQPGCLLIASSVSLVSAGTERTLVDFARGSLLNKALQQPDKVAQALQKARTDGILATVDAIQSKLEQPMAVGYCNVGRVLEIGLGVEGFSVGDRVVSNAKHAEVVVVPKALAAVIPSTVDDESAAFTVLGAIALQGIRLAAPSLGESFVVTGLGLVGLLTVQLLRANGCRVLGIDMDPDRLKLAEQFGAETFDVSRGGNLLARAARFSHGRGVDGVLLTASTKSNDPVSQAAQICRKRGRIRLVGVTGLELKRSDFYEKELTFQVSCSYGPGRYDREYEEKGNDYPLAFVRWTEQRNFAAVLDTMASGLMDLKPLISHRFPISSAAEAYDILGSSEKSLGILIMYPGIEADPNILRTRVELFSQDARAIGKGVVGFIGAGNYGGRILFRAFRDADATLHTVVSSTGVSASYYGRKFRFQRAATKPSDIFEDPNIDAVCVATRHDTHASFVRAAIQAGKHVFVEKPLCLKVSDLDAIIEDIRAVESHGRVPLLMVGFNRRFAPLVIKAKNLLSTMREPKCFAMTVNAGMVSKEHWSQDPEQGGGRIVGEGCHFIDLLRHLSGAPITEFDITSVRSPGDRGCPDTATLTLRFADGSFGVLNYLSNGHRGVPKERLEVFCGGRILVLDNFRKLTGYGWPDFSSARSWRQDKGQSGCVAAFLEAVRTGAGAPIPLQEILEVSRVSIEAAAQA